MDTPPPADTPTDAAPAPKAEKPEKPAGKPEISFDDFTKLDLRIATVKSCEPHPNADKLLLLKLDDGTEDGRQVCAGLKAYYQPEQLVGKQVIIVANLAPRKMRGEMSEGMLMAASTEARGEVIIVGPDAPITPGATVG